VVVVSGGLRGWRERGSEARGQGLLLRGCGGGHGPVRRGAASLGVPLARGVFGVRGGIVNPVGRGVKFCRSGFVAGGDGVACGRGWGVGS
jgi:hypothetical protein